MRNIVGIPLLVLAVMVQTAIAGTFSLLSGFADVVLVVLAAWALQKNVTTAVQWAFLASIIVGLVSRMPWLVYFIGYTGIVMLASMLQRRVWQVPMLAMFSVTFLGTLVLHLLSYLYLALSAPSMPLSVTLGFITLPTILLNMLIAIPVFGMMQDLARWVFPAGEAV